MPFGKWADHFIDEIPSSYLRWVAENWDENGAFKKRIVILCDKELQFREVNNCHINEE